MERTVEKLQITKITKLQELQVTNIYGIIKDFTVKTFQCGYLYLHFVRVCVCIPWYSLYLLNTVDLQFIEIIVTNMYTYYNASIIVSSFFLCPSIHRPKMSC